ncbi:MAG: hypothetical protein FJ395_08335 [Verrucomicrobia bacterium]|nr:hypothetical protein [Verrucomicrobiota bacterium]
MSTLTEIEAAVESLPPEEKQELFAFLAERVQGKAAQSPAKPVVHLLTHHFGLNPSVDLNKLGQLAEEY